MEDSRYGEALFDKSGGKDLQLQALPDPSRALRGHRLQGIYLHICCCGSFIVLAIFVVFYFVYFDVILCVLFVLVLGLDDNPFGFYLFFFFFFNVLLFDNWVCGSWSIVLDFIQFDVILCVVCNRIEIGS